jgi:hypothetical protein
MPSPTAPYGILETALQFARTRINDAIQSLSGDTLTDTAVFTIPIVNAAWRRVQFVLGDYGIPTLDRRLILPSVPLVTSSDYGSQQYLNWTGFFDGTNLQTSPVLPQDFICPLSLAERATATGGTFYPMDKCLRGMPTVVKGALNRMWEWRQDSIYIPGATAAVDILLRYAGYLADFSGVVSTSGTAVTWISGANFAGLSAGQTVIIAGVSYVIQTWNSATSITLTSTAGTQSAATWYSTSLPVPIMRAESPLAWMICAEFCKGRGDLDSAYFEQTAVDELDKIFNRDIRDERSISKPSERGKMVDPTSPLQGPAGPRGPQKAG